jgi:hypothetical protein
MPMSRNHEQGNELLAAGWKTGHWSFNVSQDASDWIGEIRRTGSPILFVFMTNLSPILQLRAACIVSHFPDVNISAIISQPFYPNLFILGQSRSRALYVYRRSPMGEAERAAKRLYVIIRRWTYNSFRGQECRCGDYDCHGHVQCKYNDEVRVCRS